MDLQSVLLFLRVGFSYLLGGDRQCGMPLVDGAVWCRCILLGVEALMLLSLLCSVSYGCLVGAGRWWVAAPVCVFGGDPLLSALRC